MDLTFSADEVDLRDRITGFARKELSSGALERDRKEEFPRDLWNKCGNMGLMGLPVPETYGGTGLSPLSCAIALEALGYGCTDSGLTFSICAHLLACVVPIWKHGDEELKRRYLPDLCAGQLIATNAMTEAQTGSDPFGMSTTAIRDQNGYRVRGSKLFCSNGPVASLALVYAITDKGKGYHGGVTAFLIPTEFLGFSRGATVREDGLAHVPHERDCPR